MDRLFSLFHWYGFFLGIGVVLGVSLCERKALQSKVSAKIFWQVVWASVAGGVFGARIYHVLTDIHLYVNDWWSVLAIWRGGLSIIGAFMGAVGASAAYLFFTKQQKYLLRLLDIVPYGAPFAQAVGRLGNLANQELYGLPSNLPWAISIDPPYRLAGYEYIEKYHPLFAYEAFFLVWFGLVLWQVSKHRRVPLGTGRIFLSYVMYYSLVRFGLEFLRLEKNVLSGSVLSVNQVVLAVFFIVGGAVMFKHKIFSSKKVLQRMFIMVFCGLLVVTLSACRKLPAATEQSQSAVQSSKSQRSISSVKDHEFTTFRLRGKTLKFEVVNTPGSLTQGLSDRKELSSDGMLFVFGEYRVPQFWMKNMQFDLDIIWLDNLKVTEITPQVPRPAPGQNLSDLPRYSPATPVNMVLEVPAGTAAAWNLQVGDVFELVE